MENVQTKDVTPQQVQSPSATEVQTPSAAIKEKRTAVRSPLLFPAYGFAEAYRITEKVETAGGGRLDETTLAIALGTSVKSSSFKLRVLTAKQFKLLQKNGAMLETTSLAKAMIKPVNGQEALHAMKESFLSIPLFNAVAARFKGQGIPQGEVFRNILERELRIPHDRVGSAEKVFLDSARDAKVLTVSGSNTYLAVEGQNQTVSINPKDFVEESEPDSNGGDVADRTDKKDRTQIRERKPSSSSGELLTISAVDLAEFEEEDFDEVWKAIGKIVQKRGKRLLGQEENK